MRSFLPFIKKLFGDREQVAAQYEIKSPQQSLNTNDKNFYIVIVSSMVLIIFLIACLIIRYAIFGTLSAPAIIAVLAISLVPIFSVFEKRMKLAGIYLAIVGATLVPFAAYQEGGLYSIPVVWFPAVPLIAMFFVGIRSGIAFAFVVVSEIVAFWLFHEMQAAFVAQQLNAEPFMFRYAAVATIAVTVFSTCLAGLSRWNESVAYQKLKDSENQFRLLSSGIPVMVWRINSDMKLDYANRNFKKFLGRRNFDNLKSIIKDQEYRKVFTTFLNAWKSRSAFKMEFSCLDAAGRTRWLTCAGVPRKYGHIGLLGFVGVCIDITEQKTKEEALKAAKVKIEQENVAKSNFLAALSHEVRTPMGIIIGYAELLKENRLIPEDCRKHLTVVDRNAKHLLELLNNVLSLSKIEANAFKHDIKTFSLREEIKNTLEPFQFITHNKGVKFSIDISKNVPSDFVESDQLLVRQVLFNLVSNAVKFTSTGSVIVKVDAVRVDDFKMKIIVKVIDTGIGVDRDEQDTIFQPFIQSKSTAMRKFGGTGLGLALSRSLATVLDGNVYIESSEPNQGSIFVFDFLVGAEIVKNLTNKLKSSKRFEVDLRGYNLLIADDIEENRELYSTFLRKAGAKVSLANDGLDAVEKAKSGNFDTILMDVQMPEMDGLEATRILRKKGINVPIIALSAHTRQDDRQNCISAGCNDYVSKPVLPSLLIQKIKEMSFFQELH